MAKKSKGDKSEGGGEYDWGDSSQYSSGGSADNFDMREVVEITKLEKSWKPLRIIGPPVSHSIHWFNFLTKEGKVTSNNRHCLNFNSKTGKTDPDGPCPFCRDLELKPKTEVYVNTVDRDAQAAQPKKTKGPTKKEAKRVKWNGGEYMFISGKDSSSWTCVSVLRVVATVGTSISEIVSLNRRKDKKSGETKPFPPSHKTYGFDIMVKYDSKAKSASNMYSVQKGDNSKITKDELDLLYWKIPTHDEAAPSLEDAEATIKWLKARLCDRSGERTFPDAEDESGDDGKKKKKKKKKGKKKGGFEDKFDEDDEDEDEDSGKKKKKKKKKSKSKDEKKGKKKSKDADDDDDEDVKKKKKKSKKDSSKGKKKKKSKDEDEDDDDEDEGEKKKSKSKSKSKSKKDSSKGKKKKKSKNEDDEDDDEDDKKSKGKSKSKSKDKDKGKKKKKSKVDDEDDDDDDIPF